MVIGYPRLRLYIIALGRLTNDKVTPRRHTLVQIQAPAYLMGDASGVGFGSMLWGQGIIILWSGGVTPQC